MLIVIIGLGSGQQHSMHMPRKGCQQPHTAHHVQLIRAATTCYLRWLFLMLQSPTAHPTYQFCSYLATLDATCRAAALPQSQGGSGSGQFLRQLLQLCHPRKKA